MKVKINRAILLKSDGTKEVIRPKIIIENVEEYRAELRYLTGAVKVFFDMEETE